MNGDQDDLLRRLRALTPPWFGGASPVADALLSGGAWLLAQVYSLVDFARLQLRLATMSGGWLELAAGDFFGDVLRRWSGEPDSSYSRRIRLEVLRPRNTRAAIDRAVFDLTGDHPSIFEGFRPASCGGIGAPGLFLGYVGAYGSSAATGDVLIATPMPKGFGVPNRAGLGDSPAGVGSTFSVTSESGLITYGPTAAEVLAALERVRAGAIAYFVRFT